MSLRISRFTKVPARSGATMRDHKHCPTLDAKDSIFFFSQSNA
jgi:hypothetical protein